MAAAAPIPVDDQGRVDVDLPCLECGYNLRTQPLETGRCPECSLPVGRSVVGNRLRYCDPRWLTQIGWGLNLFAVSLLLVGGGIGSFAIMGSSAAWDAFLIVPATLWACLVVCACYAVWKSTKPDPMTQKDEWPINPRKIARLALILTVSLPIVPVILSASGETGMRASGLIGGLWVLIACGGVLALFLYASQLAGRAQARRLKWFARLGVAAPFLAVLLQLFVSMNVFNWRGLLEIALTPFFAVNPGQAQWIQGYGYYNPSPLQIGPWRFDEWWEVWNWVEAAAWLVTFGSVLLGLTAMLWLWPVIWRQAKLARASWAGP
ncbi:MAG: hypothetical protein AAGI54_07570 [Planctomycetota bacterium]